MKTAIATSVLLLSLVHYPISQLGGCTSKDDCKVYCDAASHIQACLIFAQTHQMMTAGEVQKAILLESLTGPGGCKGQQCIVYCNDKTHATACAAFANRILSISNLIKADVATTSHTVTPPIPQPPHKGSATSSIMSYLGAAALSAVLLFLHL